MKKRNHAIVMAVGAALCGSQAADAALVGQWVADTYVTGQNWTDSSGNNVVATMVGAPVATPLIYNGHAGVTLNGTSYFTVPNNVVGATGLTLAAVFNPAAPNASTGGQFWQRAGLIGNEQGGAVNDWGLGFGANQAIAGVGAPDTSILSANLALATPHVAVMTWNTTGLLTLYVDGVQVAQQATTATAARDAASFPDYALGANLSAVNGDLKPFIGSIAELRVYNDTTVDPIALSQSLAATYVPEPGALTFIAVGGVTLLWRRRRDR